jgi:hypothetical protein
MILSLKSRTVKLFRNWWYNITYITDNNTNVTHRKYSGCPMNTKVCFFL